MYAKKTAAAVSEVFQKNLPAPSGYRILIEMPMLEEKTAGGIIRPDAFKRQEEVASIIGHVVKMGPTAYADKDRFPSGPWCQEGDFVVFRSYSGTRIMYSGKEYRIINDDTVEGTIKDPSLCGRAS
ncbi:MAG: 10 kDa chaperonin [Nitrospira sp.]|nr:10 kDa chaperonin [Nitrospira sp.]